MLLYGHDLPLVVVPASIVNVSRAQCGTMVPGAGLRKPNALRCRFRLYVSRLHSTSAVTSKAYQTPPDPTVDRVTCR